MTTATPTTPTAKTKSRQQHTQQETTTESSVEHNSYSSTLTLLVERYSYPNFRTPPTPAKMRKHTKTPPNSGGGVNPPPPTTTTTSSSASTPSKSGGSNKRRYGPSAGASSTGGSSGGGLRITYCTKFRSLFFILILIWMIYLIGIIIMAVHVHKLDPTDTTTEDQLLVPPSSSSSYHNTTSTTTDHAAKKKKNPHHQLSPHHIMTGKTNVQQQQEFLAQFKNHSLLKQQQHDEAEEKMNEMKQKLTNDLAKESIQQHVAHRTAHEEKLKKLRLQVQSKQQQQQQQQSKRGSSNSGTKMITPAKGGSSSNTGTNDRDLPSANINVPVKQPKKKRPGFKASPYGHMVQPQDLSHIIGGADNMEEMKQQKQQQEDESESSSTSHKRRRRNEILTAYIEPMNIHYWDSVNMKNIIKPLPIRQTTKHDLKQVQYPQLKSCKKLPSQFPVDNTPTNDDPFLPWIHDVIPTHDGTHIQFVAQNKRRCKTGTTIEEESILKYMAPQIALFQHVAIQRINSTTTTMNNTSSSQQQEQQQQRYRLSSHEDADLDGMATRFICRFKPSGQETLSIFHNDYEWAGVRKNHKRMFHPDGRDNQLVHASQLLFSCPVPTNLIDIVKNGTSVVDDWATLFIDLIPIRTPPRYGPPGEFLVPKYKKTLSTIPSYRNDHQQPESEFNATLEWGTNHILPLIEDSGRWENIPICLPSLMAYEPTALPSVQETGQAHHLVSCLWASSGYTTRGNRYAINDGQRRLLEWMTYNRLLGFDHFYIYDNSGAFTNETSLQPIADLFDETIVTVIPWPSQVCNNNPNNVDSIGERSSQYAAESSCRLRFGTHSKWIGQFDIDEYLVPMGDYTSILPLLDKLDKEDTKIISFASWRAWPRMSHIDEPVEIKSRAMCARADPCFELTVPLNTTVLEAYNCDRQKPGNKAKVMPAEKQLYRSDYVTQHFIHYSTVTKTTLLDLDEYKKQYGSRRPFPDPKSRFGDEVNEALMLHSKAIARQDTAGWFRNCHSNSTQKAFDQCRIGIPWPNGDDSVEVKSDENGWLYNCFVNEKVDKYWGPRLREKLQERGIIKV